MQYKLTLFIELKQYFLPKLIPSEKVQKTFSENKQLFQNCVLFPHI